MQRTARLTLWRLTPPFRKTVEIQRITLGGFLEVLNLVAPKVAAAMVQKGAPLDEPEFRLALADADTWSAGADFVAVGQRVGFLHGWLRGRLSGAFARHNANALLAASRAVEGEGQWTRYLDTLQKPPATPAPLPAPGGAVKRRKGGGLMADALLIARTFGVLPDVVKAMALRDFLDLCDAMNGEIERGESDPESAAYDPTLDPNAEPTPIH